MTELKNLLTFLVPLVILRKGKNNYSQTPLILTMTGPSKVSVLSGLNQCKGWGQGKQGKRGVGIKWVSVKPGFTVIRCPDNFSSRLFPEHYKDHGSCF